MLFIRLDFRRLSANLKFVLLFVTSKVNVQNILTEVSWYLAGGVEALPHFPSKRKKKWFINKTSPNFDKMPALSLNVIFQTASAFGLSVLQYKKQNRKKFTKWVSTEKKLSKTALKRKFHRILLGWKVFDLVKKFTYCSFWFLISVKVSEERKKTRFQYSMTFYE